MHQYRKQLDAKETDSEDEIMEKTARLKEKLDRNTNFEHADHDHLPDKDLKPILAMEKKINDLATRA